MSRLTRAYATACKVVFHKLARLSGKRAFVRDPLAPRIGMFHAIVPDGAPLSDEYALSIGALIQIVEEHRARGFAFVSLDTLLAQKSRTAARGMCVLTFDDGYEDVFTFAAPYLFEQGVPFTVYVTTDFLGRDGYLTRAQLCALADHPLCTVGSHLVTHPMTRFLRAPEALAEMTHSRDVLAALTGVPVLHLAFPYGSAYAVSARDLTLAKRAGYRSAALTLPAAFNPRSPCADYSLPRLNMLQTEL